LHHQKFKHSRLLLEELSETVMGTDNYSSKIEEIINDLQMIKNQLKKGSNKKFYRKEASRLQTAIQALRYLKKKSDKLVLQGKENV
tara:strand:- start:425 stop:682 length:258 start_codon:yes stop_codon:yes gene_type:complete